MTSKAPENDFKHKIDFEENILPYQVSETIVQNGRPDILFHWHPEMEVQYVVEGSARYHIDYDYFDSKPGDIFLIRPTGLHSIHPIDHLSHHTQNLHFHLDMLGQDQVDPISMRYLQPLQNATYKFVQRIERGDEGYNEIKRALLSIFNLIASADRHYEFLLKAKLTEFVYLLFYYRKVERKLTDDLYRKNEKIREMIDFINAHYAEHLTIDQLAEHMGYSKTHFMTVFKQQTGTSCTDFIIQARLKAACERLQNTVAPILEIATAVGFNNLSNFNRQFKHYYDMTPSQYRKINRVKNQP